MLLRGSIGSEHLVQPEHPEESCCCRDTGQVESDPPESVHEDREEQQGAAQSVGPLQAWIGWGAPHRTGQEPLDIVNGCHARQRSA